MWGALDRQPVHIALLDSIETFLGMELRAPLDGAFALAPIEALRTMAERVGFKNVHVRFEHRTERYPSAANLARGWSLPHRRPVHSLDFPMSAKQRS